MANKIYKDKDVELLDCDPKMITTDRWALENGLATVTMQENLMFYAYLSHENIIDARAIINPKEKYVHYTITLSAKAMREYKKFLQRLKRYDDTKSGKDKKEQLVQKNIRINLEDNLRKLVAEYLPKMEVRLTLVEKKLLPRWLAKLLGLKAYIQKYKDHF